jgi:hypothetical protein
MIHVTVRARFEMPSFRPAVIEGIPATTVGKNSTNSPFFSRYQRARGAIQFLSWLNSP